MIPTIKDGCAGSDGTVGIPCHYAIIEGEPDFSPAELCRLRTETANTEAALQACGFQLSHALYIRSGFAYHRIRTIQSGESPAPVKAVDPKMVVKTILQQASRTGNPDPQRMPVDDTAGADNQDHASARCETEEQLKQLRELIHRGPFTIDLCGEEILWASAVERAVLAQEAVIKMTTCEIGVTARHMIDPHGHRLYAENPQEAEGVTPGMELELSGVCHKHMLLVDLDDPQFQLDLQATRGDD